MPSLQSGSRSWRRCTRSGFQRLRGESAQRGASLSAHRWGRLQYPRERGGDEKARRPFWVYSLCSLRLFNEHFFPGDDSAVVSNGPTNRRLNVVVFSEGYTSSQLPKFLSTDVPLLLNHLFATEPFQEYAPYYNAFAISVASAESGSDHPSQGIFHNTFFNSTYETGGVTRLLTLDGTGYFRADSLLQLLMPEYDLVFVIVNDPVYGGSGGSIAVTSINSSAPEIVVHETGHTMAHLGDEYATATPGFVGNETPNTPARTDRDLIKWGTWILETTPIPTPQTSAYGGVVGLFEGASYEATGWYRPKLNCKMQTLGFPFCEVCGEALVKASYALINPIDSLSPAPGPIRSEERRVG